jgi:cellulose synthase operon protein YhjQ
MTDHKTLSGQNETPEDVATLYSWANLHGAKYRDFSASRAQTREKARQRVQQAIEEQRRRSQRVAEAQQTAEAQQAAEAERVAEESARQAERAAQIAASQPASFARPQTEQPLPPSSPWQQAASQRYSTRPQLAAQPVSVPPAPMPPQAPMPSYYASPSVSVEPPARPALQSYRSAAPEPPYPQPHTPPFTMAREANYPQPAPALWQQPEPCEQAVRPAWLTGGRLEVETPPVPKAPEDTLQGSRDRLTSRWFALKGVFDGVQARAEVQPQQQPAPVCVPVLAVFSLAGGVGKTSLLATLGRALSARGERVFLVDTASYGLLPFYFGAQDQRPGQLRTFNPPEASGDASIQMLTIDPDTLGPEAQPQEPLIQQILGHSQGVNRILIDLATASGSVTRRVLRMSPTVLVPVVPDMTSVVSVGSIEAFFKHNAKPGSKPIEPYYVLNQFDSSLPLHLDVREVLREQLGDRLLPFALHCAPAVSEALAEGMTVMDYAPNSNVAEDFGSLAGWVKSLAAPATTGYRGVRWSER